jgi:hypothetical protein
MRLVCAALAALLVAAGCGSRQAGAPAEQGTVRPVSSPCRVMTAAAADYAQSLLRAYAGSLPVGDLPLYELREDLANVQRHCSVSALGDAYVHRLTPRRLHKLFTLLPASYVRYLRQATACARGQLAAEECIRPAAVIRPAGAGKPGGTSHPFVP